MCYKCNAVMQYKLCNPENFPSRFSNPSIIPLRNHISTTFTSCRVVGSFILFIVFLKISKPKQFLDGTENICPLSI